MRRSTLLAVACSLLLTGCLGAPTTTPIACGEAGECAEGERCVSNRCVAGEGADAGATDASDADDLRDGDSTSPDATEIPQPCDGACGDDAVCDEVADRCVECLVSADCATGVCDPGANVCVTCTEDEGCSDGVCDIAADTCVECIDAGDCTGNAAGKLCNAQTNRCVQCLEPSDCDTEACDPNSNQCVGCLNAGDCGDGFVCEALSQTCVQCTESADCSAHEGRPVCDLEAQTCVQCLDNSGCVGRPDGAEVCDPGTSTCVECLEDSHCPSDAPVCTAGSCGGCAGAADCARFPDALVCDPTTQGCVECTATDESACGAVVCDVTQSLCSDRAVDSAALCNTCVSNRECAGDAVCVQLMWNGTPRGYYCQPLPDQSTCARPYAAAKQTRASITGASQEVCLIDENLTTCEAVLLRDSCTTPGSACAADASTCHMIAGLPKCTYACSDNGGCPQTRDCGAAGNYCGSP